MTNLRARWAAWASRNCAPVAPRDEAPPLAQGSVTPAGDLGGGFCGLIAVVVVLGGFAAVGWFLWVVLSGVYRWAERQ
jgi:hypothetical protein